MSICFVKNESELFPYKWCARCKEEAVGRCTGGVLAASRTAVECKHEGGSDGREPIDFPKRRDSGSRPPPSSRYWCCYRLAATRVEPTCTRLPPGAPASATSSPSEPTKHRPNHPPNRYPPPFYYNSKIYIYWFPFKKDFHSKIKAKEIEQFFRKK